MFFFNSMKKKELYRQQNEQFLADLRQQEGIKELRAGVLYKVLEEGEGEERPTPRSIVTLPFMSEPL